MPQKPETSIQRASWFWLLGAPAAVVACLLAVGNVFAVFQDFDAVLGMARGISRTKNRLNRIVFDHLLQRWIGLLALTGPGQGLATVRKHVADGNHLDIGMMLQ